MSGIYITGMEMPKSCPCELIGIGYDLCCSFAGGIPARLKEYYECCQNDTRPFWCPLIPVPDHGRLGNLDALEEYIMNDPSCITVFDAVKKLQEMPTIIPASGGNENE